MSSVSEDFDDERTKFVCNECVADDDANWGGFIGVEDDGDVGGCDIGLGHTQRNFNLSHVGQSNLLNCNWIFC